jgi:hypothetical protein
VRLQGIAELSLKFDCSSYSVQASCHMLAQCPTEFPHQTSMANYNGPKKLITINVITGSAPLEMNAKAEGPERPHP